MKLKSDSFIVMWGTPGLLALIGGISEIKRDIAQWEKDNLFNFVTESPVSPKPEIHSLKPLIQTAVLYPEKEFEIYEFNTRLTERHIRVMFIENPNEIISLIRKTGSEIYSSVRVKQKSID